MRYLALLLLFTLFWTTLLSSDEKIGSTFMGLNAGYLYNPTSSNIKIDKNAASIGFEMGYRSHENIFFSFNYNRNQLDTHIYDDTYVSVNYLFDLNKPKFSVYSGILGGWSGLTWKKKDLVELMPPSEKESSSYILGTQVGFEYTIKEDMFLYYSYIYSYTPHKTRLYNDIEVENSSRHNVMIGFRYYLYTQGKKLH